MIKRIAVDNDTFVTLKKLADKNGRTIVGQLRWFLNEQEAISRAVDTNTLPSSDNGSEDTDEPSELQQMANRLQYFEEGSPEYEEAVAKISELQKKA